MRKEQFHITGMTCSACSSRVEGCVVKLPGVKDVSVNLLKNSMVVSYDEEEMNTARIVEAVENTGLAILSGTETVTVWKSWSRRPGNAGYLLFRW